MSGITLLSAYSTWTIIGNSVDTNYVYFDEYVKLISYKILNGVSTKVCTLLGAWGCVLVKALRYYSDGLCFTYTLFNSPQV